MMLLSVIIGGYLMLKPFYIFPQGYPQVSELFLIISMYVYFLITPSIKLGVVKTNKKKIGLISLLVFVVMVTVRNTVEYFYTGGFDYIKYPLYYFFNIIIYFWILSIVENYGYLGIVKIMFFSYLFSMFSLWLIFFKEFSYSSFSMRVKLTFNNPNQLAYYGVSALFISYLFYELEEECCKKIILVIYWVSAVGLIFLSGSISGILGVIPLILFSLLIRKSFKIESIFFKIILLMSILGAFVGLWYSNYNILPYRIEKLSYNKDRQLRQRGWDRISRYPQYLIYGAGEGYWRRFEIPLEIHSTFLNILFCYGLFPFIFYLLFLITVFKRSKLKLPIFLSYAILSSIHNTIRFTPFWMIWSILTAIDASEINKNL